MSNNAKLPIHFKNISEALGPQWQYKAVSLDIDQPENIAYESISFLKDEKELFDFSFNYRDPDCLWIGSHSSFPLSIIFGPVDEVHIQEEEPKVIFERFQGEWVNFIEISSDGRIYEYHHFPKAKYRLGLHTNGS